jgi:adenylate kinase
VHLLLLGPQGSGKGTQAKRIEAEYDVPQVASGEIFRDAIASRTELGKQVEPILARGELVPDDLTGAVIRERLSETEGFVLDGFPRTLAQAYALDEMLAEIGKPLDAILFFQLDDATATERMLGRAREEGRSDDTPEVIARRLQIYHDDTEPVVEHYRATGKLVPLHADRSVNEVWAEIQTALERL